MTTVDPASWLDRLGHDIAQADANSLHAVRARLAEVAGDDPDTAVASVVQQLQDVRRHLTAVARQVFAARMASAGPSCSNALAWATQACDDAARLQTALVELAREQAPAAGESTTGAVQISRSAWLAVGASLAGSSSVAEPPATPAAARCGFGTWPSRDCARFEPRASAPKRRPRLPYAVVTRGPNCAHFGES